MAVPEFSSLSLSSRILEPTPRIWQCAVGIDTGQTIVFAGYTADFSNHEGELSSSIQIFDPYLEHWRVQETTGSPPKGLHHSAACSLSNDVYVYGGKFGTTVCGGLYKLSLSGSGEPKWTEISPEACSDGPRKKYACQMVAFNKNRIAVIGGEIASQSMSFFSSNLTNEFHVIDTNRRKFTVLVLK